MRRLERFYDALPREHARWEEYGGLVLFIREGTGWSYYARPRPGATAGPTAADLDAVRVRQRELGLPEVFEWVHENNPDLLAIARSAGLSVLEAPLMVLDPSALPPQRPLADGSVRIVDPTAPSFARDIALRQAIANLGFAAGGTARGEAGPVDRDAELVALTPVEADDERRRALTGQRLSALAETAAEGAVASGVAMRIGDTAEIAGIATLPAARRRGFGAAVTAALARRLRDTGCDLVFLSAGSEQIARIYHRIGFRRVGTACIAEPQPVRR